jgi:hypothetical protein
LGKAAGPRRPQHRRVGRGAGEYPIIRHGAGPWPEQRSTPTGQIIAALEATQGLIYQAARKVGCHADTIYHRARSSPAIREALEEERSKLADMAESKLYAAALQGRPWAVMFVLRTLGKDRGYS